MSDCQYQRREISEGRPGLDGARPSHIARQADPIDVLAVGQVEEIARTITAEDVATFARLTGDYNALHVDAEYAARTHFRQPVAHGFLHASLLSALVGMRLPGEGALYLSQSIDFTRPVFVGDTVTARGRIERIDRETRIITICTTILNQHGETVLDGQARVNVLRPAPVDEKDLTMPAVTQTTLLSGKTALVTGASRGIGRAIALTLADHGAHVVAGYLRSKQAATSLVSEIRERGGTATMVDADITDAAAAAGLVEKALARGGLDILVNNAGPGIASGTFDSFSWSQMQRAFDDIVGGVFNVIQAALPALKERQGRVVNVLSAAALGRTAHGWLPYVTAKGALLAMSKNLAQELGPARVRVNLVSPSMVATDVTADVPDRIRQMMVSRTPLRRLATPQDVAGAVLFLVSPYADFVTGENLLVTGGDLML
ncbi:MAG: SDR family oxidoreductase [Hyphomicrobiaceae bacterium]|nr:SDR family oxidoreductase [Hyphomicrobiaceae bacterium]